MRSRLVFPLPFAPRSSINSLGWIEKFRLLKRRRSPRIHPRLTASSIGSFEDLRKCDEDKQTKRTGIISEISRACHRRRTTNPRNAPPEQLVRSCCVPCILCSGPKKQSGFTANCFADCVAFEWWKFLFVFFV